MNKNDIIEIAKLRDLIPVGIIEARTLLNFYNGNIINAKDAFVEKNALQISIETGFKINQVEKLFIESHFNSQTTLRKIREIKYDESFNIDRLKGIEKINFEKIDKWIYWEGTESLESGILSEGTKHLYQFFKKHLLINEVTIVFGELVSCIEKNSSDGDNWSITVSQQETIYNSPELMRFSSKYKDHIIAIKEEIQNFIRNFQKHEPKIALRKLKNCQYFS